eukprot:NODE_12637_length_257_cov_232.816832.p1 GENE.NODE_12637_length_257_cov_232.816832~~NODE_12637_length_257_cov_232.816832.p1  ORF type:complete len:60 (-),score=7.37 NODE_12637_length_257_cov_232.816832:60-239(-)
MGDYLEQLAVAMSDEAFPPGIRAHVDQCLLGNLLQKSRRFASRRRTTSRDSTTCGPKLH